MTFRDRQQAAKRAVLSHAALAADSIDNVRAAASALDGEAVAFYAQQARDALDLVEARAQEVSPFGRRADGLVQGDGSRGDGVPVVALFAPTPSADDDSTFTLS